MRLAYRASAAATRRAAAAAANGDPAGRDRTWRDFAARCARNLGTVLGVDPIDITAQPDPARRDPSGMWPGVLLRVTDPEDSSEYLFIPETGFQDVFLALLPCPTCGLPVPWVRVAEIADLGEFLTSRGWIFDQAFWTDPGHARGCGHYRRGPAALPGSW
jgi:hypothetical protein